MLTNSSYPFLFIKHQTGSTNFIIKQKQTAYCIPFQELLFKNKKLKDNNFETTLYGPTLIN